MGIGSTSPGRNGGSARAGRGCAFDWLCVGLLLIGGCIIQNMSAEQQLREAVIRLNDDLRWHHVADATDRVCDDYRERFARSRRHWGRSLQIADTELVSLRMDGDRDGAEAVIAFRWYSRARMRLRETTVVQQWRQGAAGRGFQLVRERVVDGDPELLDRGDSASAGAT